jgi:hypothetical protein
MHHSIEEAQIFPILAKRMPEFANNSQHIASHRGIHDGAIGSDEMVPTLSPIRSRCSRGPREQVLQQPIFILTHGDEGETHQARPLTRTFTDCAWLQTCMDGFRQVLFGHLDQEVSCPPNGVASSPSNSLRSRTCGPQTSTSTGRSKSLKHCRCLCFSLLCTGTELNYVMQLMPDGNLHLFRSKERTVEMVDMYISRDQYVCCIPCFRPTHCLLYALNAT